MDLSKILTISGKPGLYQLISQAKSTLVVESLIDHKRLSAFGTEKISSLEEISIFCIEEDMPLKDVLKAIYDKENGGQALAESKLDDKILRSYFEEVLPTYDKDRVYASDIKKVVTWYNLLSKNNLLDFSEPEVIESEESPA